MTLGYSTLGSAGSRCCLPRCLPPGSSLGGVLGSRPAPAKPQFCSLTGELSQHPLGCLFSRDQVDELREFLASMLLLRLPREVRREDDARCVCKLMALGSFQFSVEVWLSLCPAV